MIKKKLWKTRYKHYLHSKEWAAKRFLVLYRDGFRCSICGSTEELNVHHKTYQNVFHEPLSDLITLCRKCHKKQHHKGG